MMFKKFLKKLSEAKVFMPEYRSMTVYGGVAFLKANSNSEVMAESKGLFVIRAIGSSASIINKEDFIPKEFLGFIHGMTSSYPVNLIIAF